MTFDEKAREIIENGCTRDGCTCESSLGNLIVKALRYEFNRGLQKAASHCICSRHTTYGFDYCEEHFKLGKPRNGARWLTPTDLAEQSEREPNLPDGGA